MLNTEEATANRRKNESQKNIAINQAGLLWKSSQNTNSTLKSWKAKRTIFRRWELCENIFFPFSFSHSLFSVFFFCSFLCLLIQFTSPRLIFSESPEYFFAVRAHTMERHSSRLCVFVFGTTPKNVLYCLSWVKKKRFIMISFKKCKCHTSAYLSLSLLKIRLSAKKKRRREKSLRDLNF